MKRTWVKVIAIVVALSLCGVGAALAQAKKAAADLDIGKALLDSYDLIEKKQYKKADVILDKVLAKDPGNPLALNNKASIMVSEKKFDKADTFLNQALPKAKGFMVQVNRVCSVGNICLAFRPVTSGTGNQDLEPLIKMNIEMVKGYMSAGPVPGKGLR
ncbi:MAG TPA: tetratricopeptide repeat protein [Desulfobaccales bacterium]|jgi:tetratricopeptide (TPR) repeat protein|nr:tetratricopeptide repeat protein [Desulfobaccales bacterium]